MPFIIEKDQENWLKGKTILALSIGTVGSFTMRFTDGTSMIFQAHRHIKSYQVYEDQIIVNRILTQ